MKGAFKERPMSRAAEPVHQEDKKSNRQKNAHACRHPTSATNEDCDFLVNFITGQESLSASFCCKLFYTIFRLCFAGDESAGDRLRKAMKKRSTAHTI